MAASAGSSAIAAPFPFTDRSDGISCPYFDVATGAAWEGAKPNWLDADGRPNGTRPYATSQVTASDDRRVRRLDITALVQAWWRGTQPNDGVLLIPADGGVVAFHSREAPDVTLRPQLLLSWANGKRKFLEARADATLDCSTYKGLGGMATLTAQRNTWIALRFDLQAAQAAARAAPSSAQLVLTRAAEFGTPTHRMQAMALRSPLGVAGPARADGIARHYPSDKGIATDADVLFADDFEGWSIHNAWSRGMRAHPSLVSADAQQHFEPLDGQALRVRIPRGEQLGLDLRYRFRDHHGSEPEEIYFRYYLRLARDWMGASNGGKLPGLAGTYGRAGWGGRRWDGSLGWSLRGSYGTALPPGHPAAGKSALGTYAYHAKATAIYGQGLQWGSGGLAGVIGADRWHCIEQRVKLNTPGRDDGELQVWVDGQLALSYTQMRLRDLPSIRIEEVWMNFYHGGIDKAPQDMHAYIDKVVIARRYIGPLAR